MALNKIRATADYREVLNQWRIANQDKTDSAIIPPLPRESGSSRHSGIASDVSALLSWRELSSLPEVLATNWRVPANDDEIDLETGQLVSRSMECEIEIRPTPEELVRAVEAVSFERGFPRVAMEGDIDYGEGYACQDGLPINGTVFPVARLGTLRFSTQYSDQKGKNPSPPRGSLIAWRAGPDKLGYEPKDDFGTPYGPSGDNVDTAKSNSFFAEMFDAQPRRQIKAGPVRRVSTPYVKPSPHPSSALPVDEARAFCGLSKVVAANDNRPAFPYLPVAAGDLFISCTATGKPEVPDTSATAHARLALVQDLEFVRCQLSPEDIKVLDAAISSANFKEVGEKLGFSGKTAERRGKQATIAASCRLARALERIPA